jgi:hypothetical protein
MAIFQIHTAAVNEPITGRDIDLKIETLPTISCI